jgi:hypothetical protein
VSEQQQPTPCDDGGGPPVLSYARPNPNRPAGGVPYIAQVILGMMAPVATGALGLAGTVVFYQHLWLVGVLAVVALIGVMLVACVRWRWPGFVAGAVAMVGLGLLGLGLCAALFIR